jgi:hypothetical protein
MPITMIKIFGLYHCSFLMWMWAADFQIGYGNPLKDGPVAVKEVHTL